MSKEHDVPVVGKTNARYNAWQSWVVKQDEVWVDIHGNVMQLDDMPRDYLLNVLIFLHTTKRSYLGDPRRNVLVKALRERILA